MDRRLAWDACYNTRDLGGLPTTDGALTRRGAIIRSDLLFRLTPAGREALLAYGVRTVIDLRFPNEVQAEPYGIQTSDGEPLRYRNIPLDKFYPDITAKINSASASADVYRLILDHYADAAAEVLRTVANAEPGGIVVHCHAGKDRTGIVTALLLRLAGVLDEEIIADYAASEPCLMPLYERIVAEARGVPAVAKPTADPEAMRGTLAYLDSAHGGVPAYLRAAGLTEAELEQLRARLRDT